MHWCKRIFNMHNTKEEALMWLCVPKASLGEMSQMQTHEHPSCSCSLEVDDKMPGFYRTNPNHNLGFHQPDDSV